MTNIFILLLALFIPVVNNFAQTENSSYLLTKDNQKISIAPDYPVFNDRGMAKVFCRHPLEKEKLNSYTSYFKTNSIEIKKIVDGDRMYIPVVLDKNFKKKKKKKKNNMGAVLARVVAKKGNLTLLTFKYNRGPVSTVDYYNSNDRYIILNENNVVVERGGIMNNYLLKPEERNLVVDENAKLLHSYFGECLGRNSSELFDFIPNVEPITHDVYEDSIPLLLWKNNNVICD